MMTDALSLDTRGTLPDELRVLAQFYPRADWRGHGNFSELTGFWLDRHLMFRDVLGRLITATEAQLDAAKPRFAAELSRYGGFFLQQLHLHHTIEDQHYFPQLLPLDARLERGLDLLESDHAVLSTRLNGFAASANAVLQDGAAQRDPVAALLAELEAMRKLLDRHLSDEEELVVPLILKYGPEITL